MKSSHLRIAVVFAVVLAVGASSGCVSKKKYLKEVSDKDALAQNLETEKAESSRLKGELEKLEAIRRNQSDSIETLGAELDGKNQQIADLDQQLLAQRDEAARLQKALRMTEEEVARREREVRERSKANDELIRKLKTEIDEGNIRISRLKEKLTLQIVDKVLFASGSDVVTDKGKEVLKKVSEVLTTLEENTIRIEGHTDNVPIGPKLMERFPSNWELSTSRATQVVRYLASLGVNPERLAAAGYSEYQPVAPNDTPENKQQNRRIEIVLTPVKTGDSEE